MKPFMGERTLVVKGRSLQDIEFEPPSPTARKILKRSKVFYRGALLGSTKPDYQRAALGLAKSYFKVS